MKLIIFAVFFGTAVTAQPVPDNDLHKEINILHLKYDRNPAGSYEFSFETENGIKRIENGEIREVLDEENISHPVVVVRGFYSYPKEDGTPETVTYYADETGYHVERSSTRKPVLVSSS
ncbi:larval cuticle protein 1-like [Melitaea cinxia]|uniref:larval cuticle protein 1-like n=1 Tax=Melitaea cinxia TaxID=113334 RepID=UPI001E26F9C2|nr:larval cuticle protein 1-like [Melitaea cinxia]